MNGSISLADLGNKWMVTRRTLYRWIRDQKLHAFQTPGGHYRVAEEEVTRFEQEMFARPRLTGKENRR